MKFFAALISTVLFMAVSAFADMSGLDIMKERFFEGKYNGET